MFFAENGVEVYCDLVLVFVRGVVQWDWWEGVERMLDFRGGIGVLKENRVNDVLVSVFRLVVGVFGVDKWCHGEGDGCWNVILFDGGNVEFWECSAVYDALCNVEWG